MSKPATSGQFVALDEQAYIKRSLRFAATSFAGGFLCGAVFMYSITPATAVNTTPAALLKIGESLCESWSGLSNITRTAPEVYTFDCRKYARFTGLEVWLKEHNTCHTDSECMARFGGDGGPGR